ncbi:NADP-dependent malic enzyme [Hippea maritima]|uniref:Malic protein NAD-binding protein n=1 Tax=Hippea maritima (strain ATCC 700847 / DSM 10411 / MH2) TaxID=760142 RepID=F2LWV1_HIPMA|nr:NADP-dependent malic enzyme [Hippea maritima]AEA33079.1 malic protein NAD-binding protein [Hippea maritima DSM 10411]
MSNSRLREEALKYHLGDRAGKIEVRPTKPLKTQKDLSLAYTPGVAEVSLVLAEDPKTAYKYTAKGNLVAVVSNGTAVLGLGNIGALASKPVMEGKGNLFKTFADIDVFDIEVNETDPDKLVDIIASLEPTFGGINLEDIKAPECFYIEEKLREKMNIPVFHDDQHGTAVISGAALLNALEITGKDISKCKLVVNGAGAAGVACAKFYMTLGIRKENIIMLDSRGVIYKGREAGMNKYKEFFAVDTDARTLEEALEGADIFLGVSKANVLTEEMVKRMSDKPIIFAMANPDPEITYDRAKNANPNVIMGTGRSDYPNQINNVLAFPFLFRGALDTLATQINDEMMMAAAKALAQLAKEDVPESVLKAYGVENLKFGPEYILPKPFDPRALFYVAPAVAEAAIKSGVAQIDESEFDLEEYKEQLRERLDKTKSVTRYIYNKAKSDPKRVVFTETTDANILRAVESSLEEGTVKPIFIGARSFTREDVAKRIKELGLKESMLDKIEFIDPLYYDKTQKYAEMLYEDRKRKGITRKEATYIMEHRPNYFAAMMVKNGDADSMIIGETYNYPAGVRPVLTVLDKEEGSVVAGLYVMIIKNKIYVFADTTVNINPTSEELVVIAKEAACFYEDLTDNKAVVAMLSFSNFGSNNQEEAKKVRRAVDILKEKHPEIVVDGEIQANVAVDRDLIDQFYPFSDLANKNVNVLIFPNLDAANIAYKLLYKMGGAYPIGPILVGLKQSAHVLEMGSTSSMIQDMIAIASFDAQRKGCK